MKEEMEDAAIEPPLWTLRVLPVTNPPLLVSLQKPNKRKKAAEEDGETDGGLIKKKKGPKEEGE